MDTLVIGAGPAGLAVGACLKRRGLPFLMLERAPDVASSWRRHYDRLHLHTDRAHSALPYLPFPTGTPRYPSRQQVIDYLEQYAQHFALAPHFGQEVQAVRPGNGGWTTATAAGLYHSRRVVVATGYNAVPQLPHWPGQERFGGRILHSSTYRNGEAFRGQNVLMVGFGNSGGEIAIDLHASGARVTLAVRGPVNVIPREILGLPVLAIGIALSRLPARVADALAAPLVRLTVGDITRLGFRKLPMGPITQIRTKARIPLIDIGTLRLVREGHIEVRGDVREMGEHRVRFDDGRWQGFDAVVAATGFRPQVDRFLAPPESAPSAGQAADAVDTAREPGLYFSGFFVSPTGMLREIGLEAQRIADHIQQQQDRQPSAARPG
ncbi:NAD(P)/FAD-dependent oxidoreductase [Polaromonas sp. SM01]|uniref:flavin-containing monooxygenase n=1 Tax=Polaromonas sp. SM01 TaxID=3085630 RepID=UPI002980BC7E|nr:NAD(P)/FAD-dependent oxidoreductase [Polaromonas sp. SM01]MDW5441156.1 NAD(P)/FAD-dependent oxidoreductase [Polaromonas sp. SM01]